MGTLEQDWDIDPEPDPERGQKKSTRDPSVDDWQKAADQYQASLDRLADDAYEARYGRD